MPQTNPIARPVYKMDVPTTLHTFRLTDYLVAPNVLFAATDFMVSTAINNTGTKTIKVSLLMLPTHPSVKPYTGVVCVVNVLYITAVTNINLGTSVITMSALPVWIMLTFPSINVTSKPRKK